MRIQKTTPIKPLPVELSAYDGEQSILLSWVKTKNRTTNCEPIFQKIWSKRVYTACKKVEPENTKYLDYHCDPGERYFYKLEFIDVKGEKYIANNIMPPFANCLDAETELHNIRNFNALEDI